MAYDELKVFKGEPYTGMTVGDRHMWVYPRGVWRETKVAPDRWEFTFASRKQREGHAPVGSGAALGTQYHWYLLAHQWVRKVDADAYATFMSGVKHKVSHRRPQWDRWSSEYTGRLSDREREIQILEETLIDLRGGAVVPGELRFDMGNSSRVREYPSSEEPHQSLAEGRGPRSLARPVTSSARGT